MSNFPSSRHEKKNKFQGMAPFRATEWASQVFCALLCLAHGPNLPTKHARILRASKTHKVQNIFIAHHSYQKKLDPDAWAYAQQCPRARARRTRRLRPASAPTSRAAKSAPRDREQTGHSASVWGTHRKSIFKPRREPPLERREMTITKVACPQPQRWWQDMDDSRAMSASRTPNMSPEAMALEVEGAGAPPRPLCRSLPENLSSLSLHMNVSRCASFAPRRCPRAHVAPTLRMGVSCWPRRRPRALSLRRPGSRKNAQHPRRSGFPSVSY